MATCIQSAKPLKAKENQNEDDMRCTICLSLKKDPRLLPCLHSYCKGCLDTILSKPVRKSTTLSCPQCRVEHAIPREGATGFPQDQVLANAIKVHVAKTQGEQSQTKETKTVRQCTMCTEDDPATSFCSTCGKFLCDFCHKAHKRLVDFCDHKYTPLSEIDQVDKLAATAELPSYCTLHSGEVLKLYCRTCQKVICRDCTIVTHRNHEYGFINELRPQVQQGIETTITRLKAKQKEFQAHLTFLKDLETSRNAHASAIENEITRAFNSYIEALKTCQAELLSIEQGSKEADLKQIWAEKQHVETMLANLSSAVRYAERLCACPSDKVMLAMQGETTSRLNSLQCTTWNASDIQEISVPSTFTETKLNLSDTGLLEPQSVSLSMRVEKFFLGSHAFEGYKQIALRETPEQREMDMYLATCQEHENIIHGGSGGGESVSDILTKRTHYTLRNEVCYVIEVNSSKNDCLTVPSVTVTNSSKDHYISYNLRYHGDGMWSLTYTPPYPGEFTTTVSINTRHESTSKKVLTYSGYSIRNAMKSSPNDQKNYSRKCTAYQKARVTGSFQVGDLVRRGPHWKGGDEDGGVGGVGTVTEVNQIIEQQFKHNPAKSHARPRHSAKVYAEISVQLTVKWENGRIGEYKAQVGCFEVELVPFELKTRNLG